MARHKKGAPAPRGGTKARGGRGRGGKGGFRGRGDHAFTSPRTDFIRDETVGFTLADEARQTSQHDHSAWGSSTLRSRPVAFVSAGPSEPLKLLEAIIDTAEDSKITRKAEGEDAEENIEEEEDEEDEEGEEVDHDQLGEQEPEDQSGEDGFIGPDDLEKAIQAGTVAAEDAQTEPSFFFDLKGDQSIENRNRDPVKIPERPSSRSSSSSEEIILFKGRGGQKRNETASGIDMVQMQAEIRVVEQAIIAKPTHLAPSPAPELPTEPVRSKKLSKKEKKQKHREKRNAKTRFEDDEDAILADYIANLRDNTDVDDYFKQLLEGGNDSDDSGASEIFASNVKRDRIAGDVDDPECDESDEDSEDDAEVTHEDELQSEIDDETLAGLIAGHQFSQDLGTEDVNFGDSSDSDLASDEPTSKTKQRQMLEDEFDVMDWDRPSLHSRKGKGARNQINFNLSDSELEATLQASWKNDRLKKSNRKRQREEMRALGMLGKNVNPDDLRVKYPDGMNMEQVADEMRTFMLSTDEQLTLPPMDNHARKMIHELANKFRIKSKSIGKGDQRRPTLYRTLRTPPYVKTTFDQAFNRVNRKYLPRLDKKGKKGKRLPPVRGGTSVAAATYQDGEVVGASAPELGIDNRGRAMLEKMGWSMGTALGSTNNKGIMQPVTHTMKRTKAGLG